MTTDEKKKKASKLHQQFSHASAEKLIQLVKNNDHTDKGFHKYIGENCTM